MTMTTLAAWSQIGASVAVLITLIYLTIQIKQNTASVRSESRQSAVTNEQTLLYRWVERPTVFLSILSSDEPTPEERVQIHMMMVAAMRAREHEWFQYRSGVIDDMTWASYFEAVVIFLGTKRTRQWWEKVGQEIFNPGFVEDVNRLLASRPDAEEHYSAILSNW